MHLYYHNMYMMNMFMSQQQLLQQNPIDPSPQSYVPKNSEFNEVKKWETSILETQEMQIEEVNKPTNNSALLPKRVNVRLTIKEVETIMTVIVDNYQKSTNEWISELKDNFSCDSQAQELIHILLKRFKVQKTREEIIKYIMRVIFKKLQGDFYCPQLSHLPQKHFVKAFVIFYFKGILKEEEECCSENFDFLPFRKGSKLKTMNKDFLKKIMSSEKFKMEFVKFAQDFDKIFSKINRKKIAKTNMKIFKCLQTNDLKKLEKLRGFPWLQSWLDNAKEICFEILDSHDAATRVQEPKSIKDDSGLKTCLKLRQRSNSVN